MTLSEITSHLTIIFPLAVALGILLWCWRWADIHRKNALVPAAEQTRPEPDRSMKKRDWLAVGALTAVYAVVAFVGLGDTEAIP